METGIQKYIDTASEILKRFNIKISQEPSPLAAILSEVSTIDEPRVLAISKVLDHESAFNQLVRDNVAEMNVGTRYADITTLFDSVVTDANFLVHELDDGKIDAKEKAQNMWMKLARGTTHSRFEKITKIHTSVSSDTKEQLDKEEAIRDAYVQFRLAYLDARTRTLELMEIQEKRLKSAQEIFATASKEVETYMAKGAEANQVELSRMQRNRDEKMLDERKEDSRYQLLKDLSEGFTNGYNVGEVLMAKLMQTHAAKQQVYRKNTLFFATNEHIFTTLDLVLTSQLGLHEQTQTLEAEKRVVNKGLEAIADLGNNIEKAAIKAGYGSTTDPASLKKLVDSVVNYQIETRKDIETYRAQSANDAKEVEAIVESGKARLLQAARKYQAAA
jgi:hypothetical protein